MAVSHREMHSYANQKSAQLINMLSLVMKSMNEMAAGMIRNMW